MLRRLAPELEKSYIEINLRNGRNDLENYMNAGARLELLLTSGRLLQSDWHDTEGCKNGHMHLYRKILATYDPARDAVLLSKQGSRRLIGLLDEPDREFSK